MRTALPAVIVILLLNCFFVRAQNTIHIKNTVQGINQGDYNLVKKQWGPIGRILIRKKNLQDEFTPYHNKYGEFQIDTIVFNSKFNATVEIFHPKSPYQRSFLTCNLNKKGKLQGLGFGWPTFIYPLRNKNRPVYDSTALKVRIDSLVNNWVNQSKPYNFNGSILVCKTDSVYYKRNVGFTSVNNQTLINDSTRFLLASLTKQFTAVAILQLKDKALLSLDDKVCKYLPSLPYKNVTIKHLLTHTSGIPDYMPLLMKHWDHSKYATNQDILSLLSKHSPKQIFTSNSSFSYSNTGYILLSLIIEKVSGKTYAAFLDSSIFKPLNMHHTSVYHRRKAGDTLSNYAVGSVYSNQKNKYTLPDSLSAYSYVKYMDCITGDDGVSSTTNDLRKWNEALINRTLLSNESSNQMNTSHVLSNGRQTGYGYGIILKTGESIHDLAYHTGSWPGYKCLIARFKDIDLQVIILSNNDFSFCERLMDEIAIGFL